MTPTSEQSLSAIERVERAMQHGQKHGILLLQHNELWDCLETLVSVAKRAVREPSDEEIWHVARALSIPEHHTTWDTLSEQEKDLFFMQASYGIKAFQGGGE